MICHSTQFHILEQLINVQKYCNYSVTLFNKELCKQIKLLGIATLQNDCVFINIFDKKSRMLLPHIDTALKRTPDYLIISAKFKKLHIPYNLYQKVKYIRFKCTYIPLINEYDVSDKLILNYGSKNKHKVLMYIVKKRIRNTDADINAQYLASPSRYFVPPEWIPLHYNNNLDMIVFARA